MSAQRDGGPAFPRRTLSKGDHGYPVQSDGMSLRDWLAGEAPIDFDAACNTWGGVPQISNDKERAAFLAVWAMARYEYADAMLDAREVRS